MIDVARLLQGVRWKRIGLVLVFDNIFGLGSRFWLLLITLHLFFYINVCFEVLSILNILIGNGVNVHRDAI